MCSAQNMYLGFGTKIMAGIQTATVVESAGLEKQRVLLGKNRQKNKCYLEIGRDTRLPLLSVIKIKGSKIGRDRHAIGKNFELLGMWFRVYIKGEYQEELAFSDAPEDSSSDH